MRGIVLLLGALALLPAGRGAGGSIELSATAFSPALGVVTITAQAQSPALVGVRLSSLHGRPLGWLDPPAKRQQAVLVWGGTLGGAAVHDGYYDVELVVDGRVEATAELHIDSTPARLDRLSVSNGGDSFAGDGPLLTTLSPNGAGDGDRDAAAIQFTLSEAAGVTLNVQRTAAKAVVTIFTQTWQLPAGENTVSWAPAVGVPPRTYVLSLTTEDAVGNRLTYGSPDPFVDRYPRAPVARVLGIDAAFTRQSYSPGRLGGLRIATDAPELQLQVFRTGSERIVTYADYLLEGVPVTDPVTIDWRAYREAPHELAVRIGDWPSGFYFAKLTAPDGRFGYAPFIVRPAVLGAASRVLVVLATNSWQAYNFYDVDGDGWGETWFAGAPHQTTSLDRPYLHHGVPPFFYRYEQGFLHWLYWTGKKADFFAECDLESVSGDTLARDYDLIVFPGHTESVTEHEYDAIERYRDLGGNLMFLSSNNFFRRVDLEDRGTVLHWIARWRKLGRPEAALLGLQYIANDRGRPRGLYTVVHPAAALWLWAGTGLTAGSTFGQAVGGYGIEIDHTNRDSPPGTIVLAQIPNVLGPGLTAQMTYYQTRAGAKVFSAGTTNFGGSATTTPVSRLLENLWARLSKP